MGRIVIMEGMEPNRYWLLYFGLLFIFLGSKVGQAFRWWIYNIFRACFYAALALAAFAAAKLLLAVSFLLLKFTDMHMQEQETHASAKSGAGTSSPQKESG